MVKNIIKTKVKKGGFLPGDVNDFQCTIFGDIDKLDKEGVDKLAYLREVFGIRNYTKYIKEVIGTDTTGYEILLDNINKIDDEYIINTKTKDWNIVNFTLDETTKVSFDTKVVVSEKKNGKGKKLKLKEEKDGRYTVVITEDKKYYLSLKGTKKKKKNIKMKTASIKMAASTPDSYTIKKILYCPKKGDIRPAGEDWQIMCLGTELQFGVEDYEKSKREGADISGSVIETIGATVPSIYIGGVKVSLINTVTNEVVDEVQSCSGEEYNYKIENVPEGKYLLKYEKEGYRTQRFYLQISGTYNVMENYPIEIMKEDRFRTISSSIKHWYATSSGSAADKQFNKATVKLMPGINNFNEEEAIILKLDEDGILYLKDFPANYYTIVVYSASNEKVKIENNIFYVPAY